MSNETKNQLNDNQLININGGIYMHKKGFDGFDQVVIKDNGKVKAIFKTEQEAIDYAKKKKYSTRKVDEVEWRALQSTISYLKPKSKK